MPHFLCRYLLPIILGCMLPLIVHAEAKVRIGAIMTADIPYYRAMHEAFASTLGNTLPAGEKVEIIIQKPFPDPISLSNAARKLIAYDVNLIVTYGSPATHAVLDENSSIPVVYAGVYDPDEAGLPGKKMTGSGFMIPISSLVRYLKRLEKINTLGIVFSSVEEDSARQAAELLGLAEQQDVRVKKMDIRTRKDFEQLDTMEANDAIFITGSSLVHLELDKIITAARRLKIPTASLFPDNEEEGVLITLYQPANEQGERAAEMAREVLAGNQAKNITPYVSRDTELVFNLREAKKLGLIFPVQVIIEATRIIK